MLTALILAIFPCNGFGAENVAQGVKVIVIDAGHGGMDGGATSCTGVLESKINLDIALKLEKLLCLRQ